MGPLPAEPPGKRLAGVGDKDMVRGLPVLWLGKMTQKGTPQVRVSMQGRDWSLRSHREIEKMMAQSRGNMKFCCCCCYCFNLL